MQKYDSSRVLLPKDAEFAGPSPENTLKNPRITHNHSDQEIYTISLTHTISALSLGHSFALRYCKIEEMSVGALVGELTFKDYFMIFSH
jgi:hypothetical protein